MKQQLTALLSTALMFSLHDSPMFGWITETPACAAAAAWMKLHGRLQA